MKSNTKKPEQFWMELIGSIAVYDEVEKRRERNNSVENEKIFLEDISLKVRDPEIISTYNYIIAITKKYKPLYRKILIDMDKFHFKNTNSVNKNNDKHLMERNDRYSLLSSVNLFSHTINVVTETIKITKDMQQDIKDISILLALLHDFGKNSEVISSSQLEEKNKTKHSYVSANYAKHLIKNESFSYESINQINKEFIDLIYECLRTHHDDYDSNIFVKILNDADSNARELELDGVLLKEIKKKKLRNNNDS